MDTADTVIQASALRKVFARASPASGRGYATGGVPGDLALKLWLKLRRQLLARPITALDGVDLRVQRGQFIGLLGPNGAGKSTLLRLIAGLAQPTGGELRVFGYDPGRRRSEVMRRTSFVAGALTGGVWVDPDLPARRNLQLMADLFSLPAARTDAVLAEVGLGDVADRRVGGFSSGMAARLQLAFGLLRPAELLVLDEPTEGLSPDAVEGFHALLQRRCREGGTTIVYASHHLAELEPFLTHVVLLAKGKALAQGPVRELAQVIAPGERIAIECTPAPDGALERLASLPGVASARLVSPPRGDGQPGIELHVPDSRRALPEVLAVLVGQGQYQIRHVDVSRPSLADVYRWYVDRESERNALASS